MVPLEVTDTSTQMLLKVILKNCIYNSGADLQSVSYF